MNDTNIKISNLFEAKAFSPRFKSIQCELEAIASRKKAMSVFLTPHDKLIGKENKSIYRIAEELKLTIIYCPSQYQAIYNDIPESYIFVMRDYDSGRVATYLATRQILHEYEWSDGLEILESLLLGYSKDDVVQWMTMVKNRQLTWTGINIYFLMNAEQLNRSALLGYKCIDPDFHVNGIDIFFNKKNMLLKHNADLIIGKEFYISRCSLTRGAFTEIFGSPINWEPSDFPRAFVAKDNIIKLNGGIERKINIYKEGIWH